VLRGILRVKGDEVTGERRKLHNQERNDLHTSQKFIGVKKSRRMRWAGRVACLAGRRVACILLLGKPEGYRPLGN
jgi:hypothetical protein